MKKLKTKGFLFFFIYFILNPHPSIGLLILEKEREEVVGEREKH